MPRAARLKWVEERIVVHAPLRAVHVREEGLQGADPLGDARRDLLPLVLRDDAGHDVDGEGSLLAREVERHTLLEVGARQHVGAGPQVRGGLLGERGVHAGVRGPNLAVVAQHLVPGPAGRVAVEQVRHAGQGNPPVSAPCDGRIAGTSRPRRTDDASGAVRVPPMASRWWERVRDGLRAAGLTRRGAAGASPAAPPAAAPARPAGHVVLPDFTGRLTPVYAPDPDGDADPGEIVWTWVSYEDDRTRGKDRPVLVVGHDEPFLLALMLTSKDHTRDAAREAREGRRWLDIGSGDWDAQRRPSEVRLDRVLRIDPAAVRREGAVLPRPLFDQVVESLGETAGW